MTHLLLAMMVLLQVQAPPPRPGTGSISGRIVFSDGTPAVSVVVTSAAAPEPGRPPAPGPVRSLGFTDQAGAFRLQNVPPGRYYLRFGSPDWLYFPGVVSESAATVLNVTADTPIENLNVALSPALSGVRVGGRVVSPADQPIQSTQRVQINGGSFGPLVGSISQDGTFEVLHVRPGRYTITITQAPGMQAQPIAVSDVDLPDVQLNVPRLVPVDGAVVLEARGVRPRFSLALEGPAYRTNVPVTESGSFATRVPEGQYLPRLTGLPSGYYITSLTAGETDLLTYPLKITDLDMTVPLRITLGTSSGVPLTGRVAVPGTDGASAIKNVALLARALDRIVEVPLEEDGSFHLENILPGAYLARVTLWSNLAAPLVPVTVPEKDLRAVEIALPEEVDVIGRVTVDGYGPPPKFSLLLISGSAEGWSAAKPGQLPMISNSGLLMLQPGGGGVGTQAVQMNVNALPDGTFKLRLPEGEYRVAAPTGGTAIPSAYSVRSIDYGPADLLKEAMTVSASTHSELQIGFAPTASNPWAKVSGRVKGFDPAKGPARVSLEGRTTAAIETPVNPDGSFEFLRTLQGTTYTASLVPANDAASSPTITVADKDVEGVEIVVPIEKEVRIVPSAEEGAPIPGFMMTFAGAGSSVSVVVKPERAGVFKATLPADERRVRIDGFPIGYIVKAVTYGATNLLSSPMKLTDDDSLEIKVQFALDPAVPSGSVRGHVAGVDALRNSVQLVLNGVTSFSSFETSLDPDGSFAFSKIPQGTYLPTLTSVRFSGLLSPATVVVAGSDPFDIELTVPKQNGPDRKGPNDDSPTGVVVSNPGASREAANESSAVANLRTINTALVTYLSSNGGRYGNIPDLIKAGLLDGRFGGVVSGFSYSIINAGGTYAAAAIPASSGAARFGYFSMSDAVIRYSTLDLLSPPRQAGNPVQ